MSGVLPPFPTIEVEPERRQWPTPPFAWRHVQPPDNDVEQPCSIELSWGTTVNGEMLDFNPTAAHLKFRMSDRPSGVIVPFRRVRRLVMKDPLVPAPRMPGAPVERLPSVAQEREYRLHAREGNPIVGRTAGYVANDAGLYLFTPMGDGRTLQRVFVPRCAYTACEFGRSAEEIAAERWIATRHELLAAIELQQRATVIRIGEALINLGLVTHEQLYRTLAEQRGDQPLGELLVSSRVISRSDLNTALAHKMGYPLVDLTRFPIDIEAVRLLPLRLAIASRALPLMKHGTRLIVAVDRPSRTEKLHNLQVFTGMKLVPVLASKGHIMLALNDLAHQDVWTHNVFARVVFAPTTI